jgi:type II secretory pathway component GspD/PulD (secretin)
MEILIVRTNWNMNEQRAVRLSGQTEEVIAQIQELQSNGQMVVTDRVSLTILENEETTIQCGKTTPVATGQSFGGRGGPPQRSYQHQDFGTLISVLAKIDGDAIVAKLNVEKSQLGRRGTGSESDDEFAPPEVETLTSQANVRIKDGRTVLVSGLENQVDEDLSGQFVLASARLLDSSASATDNASSDTENSEQIRVYSLRNTSAGDAASLVEERYDEMDQQQLRDELRRLQRELLDAWQVHNQASREAREADTAYKNAPDDEKADALLRMLEADAASRAPMKRYRQARAALDAASQSYLRRLLAE